jgi:hypothetical protein
MSFLCNDTEHGPNNYRDTKLSTFSFLKNGLVTFIQGRGEGGGEVTSEKDKGALVHKRGPKIPT